MNEKDMLLLQLEQAFDRKSWHGTNLLGSIRGIDVTEAAWRPADDRHNIWEIILHAAYWKYSVYRRISGGDRGSFPIAGSNWFVRPNEGGRKELRTDIALLKDFHRRLIEEVRAIDPGRLGEVPAGSKFAYRDLIIGVAAHDLYHAGQIQLLKRLFKGE